MYDVPSKLEQVMNKGKGDTKGKGEGKGEGEDGDARETASEPWLTGCLYAALPTSK
jgi:hypothetical protein